jgi:parallel beta-helix repeat protein
MKALSLSKFLFIMCILVLPGISTSYSLPIDLHLNSWTKVTLPQGHYVNINQISTPYGDGISIDTIGYPDANDYLYYFLAYYTKLYTVPETGKIEIEGYFYYNDTSYIVSPSRKYIAAYLIQPDLSGIIATTHILDYENGELSGVWYYRNFVIENLTGGQQYYLAFGRYDYFAYERYLQAAWAAVDLAPPHLLKVPQDFATINEAIYNAIDGDTVEVAHGIYHENLIIDKAINLIGEDNITTIVDANQSGAAIFIISKKVTLKGFTIRNSGSNPGLLLTSSIGTEITQNIIEDNQYGISLQNSNNTTITRNRIVNNDVGIQITLNSNNTTIFHNDFNNTQQTDLELTSNNRWDNGFEEGNYWSDYSGEDQNADGIGDTMLPWQNVDNHPLIRPYIEGDVNHNGIVNIADVALLIISWQTMRGQPDYNPHADLNLDEKIDIIDAATIARNWLQHSALT